MSNIILVLLAVADLISQEISCYQVNAAAPTPLNEYPTDIARAETSPVADATVVPVKQPQKETETIHAHIMQYHAIFEPRTDGTPTFGNPLTCEELRTVCFLGVGLLARHDLKTKYGRNEKARNDTS